MSRFGRQRGDRHGGGPQRPPIRPFDAVVAAHLFGLEVEALKMLALSMELRDRADAILRGIDALTFPAPPIIDPPCREGE